MFRTCNLLMTENSFCLLTQTIPRICVHERSPVLLPATWQAVQISKVSLPNERTLKKIQIQSLPTVQHFSGGSSGECWTGFRSRECLFPIYFGGYKRKQKNSWVHASSWKGVASTRILLFRLFGCSIGTWQTVSCPGSISLHIWKHSLSYVEIPLESQVSTYFGPFFPGFVGTFGIFWRAGSWRVE